MKFIKDFYTYCKEDVICLYDDDHTPFNKRPAECESELEVQVRSNVEDDWINLTVKESTRPFMAPKGENVRSRTISFTITREQFKKIAAHVNRGKMNEK